MAVLTGSQIRAARALLRWEQKRLADDARVSLETVKRLEGMQGPVSAMAGTVDAVRAAFEAAGVQFIGPDEASPGGGPGVRLNKGGPLFG